MYLSGSAMRKSSSHPRIDLVQFFSSNVDDSKTIRRSSGSSAAASGMFSLVKGGNVFTYSDALGCELLGSFSGDRDRGGVSALDERRPRRDNLSKTMSFCR